MTRLLGCAQFASTEATRRFTTEGMIAQNIGKRYDYSRWLWTMGASPRDALALVAAYNSRAWRKRLGLAGVAAVTAHLKANGSALPFRFRDASDFVVLGEVFRECQYMLEAELDPRIIVDLGANTGLSAMFLHSLFPAARVLAVEAHPDTFERLRGNADLWDNVEALHLAATDRDGDVEFFGTKERGISSSMFRRSDADASVTVPGETLATLLERCPGRVDVLKFDIEGAELAVFSAFQDWDRLGVLIGEVHPDLYEGTLEQFFALFPRHDARVLHEMGQRAVVRLDPR